MSNDSAPRGQQDQEFLIRHYAKQVADLRDENQRLVRERDDLAAIFTRVIKWLRGEDKEFSKMIVEFRDSRKSHAE